IEPAIIIPGVMRPSTASQFADPEPATERFADSDYPADGGFADGDFSDSDFNDDSSFLGDDDLFT
ncbi:DUF2076 domain-containing protein, partial [Pseudomonas aeruginosa]|nr:DUF2076 domain-containing protein [Pseudomonas aeruginosa]